jgi:cobalt-zinc-cadmium efflux system protein
VRRGKSIAFRPARSFLTVIAIRAVIDHGRAANPRCKAEQIAVRIEQMHEQAEKSGSHSHDGHSHGHDHAHDHDHGHGLGGHSHVSLPAEGMTLALGAAVVATFALVAVELLAGYAGHSIALVSDAVHNLTDVPTLVLSWLAMRWAAKPPTPQKTYGYHRAGILAAFVNAMLLTLVSLGLIYESVLRLRTPVEVKAGLMLWVSGFALLINGGITLALHSGRRDLNLRSVWIHNLGDALSNVAIVVGALAIRYTGTTWADPVIGIAIGAMVLWSGVGILRESTHILLEGLPRSIALEEVARALLKIEGVQEVHDIHIWTLGTDLNALSCHICIPDMHMEESEKVLAKIHEVLDHDFRITHTTIQFERAGLPADAGLYMPEPIRRSEG